MLDVPEDTFAAAYNGIANSVLWFVHHLLFDTPVQPRFDAGFRRDWAAYVAYNQAFADALAEESVTGTRVLVQDYHLALAPGCCGSPARDPDRALRAHPQLAGLLSPAAERRRCRRP